MQERYQIIGQLKFIFKKNTERQAKSYFFFFRLPVSLRVFLDNLLELRKKKIGQRRRKLR